MMTFVGTARNGKGQQCFASLRDAVWNKVAHTLLKQEEEKGRQEEDKNEPLNLSSNITIRGETIIEHIIENILDKNSDIQTNSSSSFNNNPLNSASTTTSTTPSTNNAASQLSGSNVEEVKDRIYESLKVSMIAISEVKSRFKELPRSAHFDSLNWDFTLNRDFLLRFYWHFGRKILYLTLNQDSLN